MQNSDIFHLCVHEFLAFPNKITFVDIKIHYVGLEPLVFTLANTSTISINIGISFLMTINVSVPLT